MFEISAYRDNLSGQLSVYLPSRRLAFGAWATERLKSQFYGHLSREIGDKWVESLSSGLDSVWKAIVGKEKIDPILIGLARATCVSCKLDIDSCVTEEDRFMTYGAEELLGAFLDLFECAETSSPVAAAQCGLHVINCIDYRLSMIDGILDPFKHDLMKTELDRQQHMAVYLKDCELDNSLRSAFSY
jgi:hypothetical protein